MLIYMVTNVIDGKMYIGQTVGSLKQRRSQHISDTRTKRDNCYFHKALRKYDQYNFEWTILHDGITTIEDLNRLEIFYIGYYDTFGEGYNLTLGGGGMIGYIPSEEHKRKISVANKGKKASDETRRKQSESRKGEKRSEETKRRMSEAKKGKKHSEESKRRMSEAKKGKNHHRAIPVTVDGKYFDTITKAAKFVGVGPGCIRKRILHPTKWKNYHYAQK